MSVSTLEQETVINMERESDVCTIWTSDTTMMTRLDKLVKDEKDWGIVEVSTVKGEVVGKKYKTNKGLISFRGHKVSREMSDEQRQAAADRLREARSKKENFNNE